MLRLVDLYFGELEAFDEALNEPEYFKKTYVAPASIDTSALRNNRKFIVVGRKGAGKTAVQMELASSLADQGYLTIFFRFSDDLRAQEITNLSKTQSHFSAISVYNEKELFLNYDFRDIWERVFLYKIAELLSNAGFSNKFIAFCQPNGGSLSNIFSGLTKSLTLSVSAELMGFAAEIGVDPSKYPDRQIPLYEHNRVAKELFTRYAGQYRIYFFIDELVFSRLDAKDDQITIKAAMVRDIVRVCRDLNNLAQRNNLDIHLICSLRPEIRNLINDFDAEMGKILDGKDVALDWYIEENRHVPLIYEVFQRKVQFANFQHSTKPLDINTALTPGIAFGGKMLSLVDFIKTNTWGRPRDVVRLLLAIQKKSPRSERIGEAELKIGLDEYSRASLKELVDELSVVHGKTILDALKRGIKKKNYHDADEFVQSLPLPGVNEARFLDDAFSLGLFGGYQPETGNFYWAHRGETTFRPHLQVRIHPALWNELSIRGSD